MSDDKFEDWLRDTAQDYNRPTAHVPREDMWQAIQAARRQAQVRALPPSGSRRRHPPAWRVAAAAVLLVGAGIGIGYGLRGANTSSNVAVVDTAGSTMRDSASANALTTYDVAAAQHLTSAEVLLTAFQASADAESVDAAQRWARSLLSTTRLLLDSPAATDPERRRLFEDLERILVQIVQLAPDAPADDRAYVERVIGRDQVLTRIRTSIPAGFPAGS